MKSRVEMFLKIFTFLLILLWVYAALSKLADFQHFKKQMGKQSLTSLLLLLASSYLPQALLLSLALQQFLFPTMPYAWLAKCEHLTLPHTHLL